MNVYQLLELLNETNFTFRNRQLLWADICDRIVAEFEKYNTSDDRPRQVAKLRRQHADNPAIKNQLNQACLAVVSCAFQICYDNLDFVVLTTCIRDSANQDDEIKYVLELIKTYKTKGS